MAEAQEPHLRALFGRDLLYAGLYVAQLVLVALSTPILTRILPKSQFGTISICMTVMQLLVVLSTWSMDLGVQRLFSTDGEALARKLVTVGAMMASTMFVIQLTTGHWWAPAAELGNFSGAIATTVVWTLLTAITAPCLGLLRSQEKFWRYATVAIVQTTLAEAFSVVLVLAVRRTAAEYVLGETIAQAVALGVALIFVRPALPRRADIAILMPAVAYASLRLPNLIVGFVDASSDRLIINADLGHYQLARYAIAGNIASFAVAMVYGISQSWMPRAMAIRDADELRRTFSRARDRLMMLAFPVVLAMCAVAVIVLRIWAPSSYRPDHLQIIVALTAFMVFPAIGDVALWQMFAGANARALPIVSACTAVLNVALNIVLVPVIGLAGSVSATIVATSAEYVLLRSWLPKDHRLNRPSPALVVDGAIACCLGIGLTLLPTSVPFLALRMVVAILAGYVALALLVSASGRVQSPFTSWAHTWLASRTD